MKDVGAVDWVRSVGVLPEELQGPMVAHSLGRALEPGLVQCAGQHGSTSLPNQIDINALSQQLLLAIRQGVEEDFLDALMCNSYDFDTQEQAVVMFLDRSTPDDWRNARCWFGNIRPDLSSSVCFDTPIEDAFLSIMRRWLADPEWHDDSCAHLQDFAQDMLHLRRK